MQNIVPCAMSFNWCTFQSAAMELSSFHRVGQTIYVVLVCATKVGRNSNECSGGGHTLYIAPLHLPTKILVYWRSIGLQPDLLLALLSANRVIRTIVVIDLKYLHFISFGKLFITNIFVALTAWGGGFKC